MSGKRARSLAPSRRRRRSTGEEARASPTAAEQLWLPGLGKQPWLPGVAPIPERLTLAETRAARSYGTRCETEDECAGRVVRAELAAELERQEWAADGGEGCVWPLSELETSPALNLEWMLNGALLEAMAAVLVRTEEARSIALEQPDIFSEVAE